MRATMTGASDLFVDDGGSIRLVRQRQRELCTEAAVTEQRCVKGGLLRGFYYALRGSCKDKGFVFKNRPRARTTRRRRQHASEDDTRKGGMYTLLLLLPFFSLNRLPTVDFSLNRPPTIDFSFNRSLTAEIDRQQSILVVPPDSKRSTYRSAAGSICTAHIGRYRLKLQTLRPSA
ncbi:hypothetical protein BHE74_00043105 [Ensete ventricosum]|nr:hypothetical protein GW17_00054498 [Ensete ventricosum]RWW50625.1 hypothetical protein BHE74_00043105 [Ensete ventricosum]RZS17422.1 hypothetical protein BHM03_00049558 [Ensete ventricosum]